MQFSVLISVYIKEKPIFLKESLESILKNQTVKPDEVVIVKDGKLTTELDDVIKEYEDKYSSIVKVISLEENVGLGKALNIGLEHCSFEFVARMDTDDISTNNRFEKQMKLLEENPELDVVGSNIAEFFSNKEEVEFIRKVPQSNEAILKMAKKRNPVNHVSVIFKKSSVIKAGGYKHLLYAEDYYLWIRMLAKGYKFYNIDEELVFVRTGYEMFKRRSNKKQISGWWKLQKELYRLGIINHIDQFVNMVSIVGFVYIPPTIKEPIYKFLLRG